MTTTALIRIDDGAIHRASSSLFAVLATLMPIRFATDAVDDHIGCVTSDSAFGGATTHSIDRPTLVLPAPAETADFSAAVISFADDPDVPWPFRGRTLEVEVDIDREVQSRMARHGGKMLASSRGSGPIWTIASASNGARIHRTSLRLPAARSGDDVGVAAGGERFMQALPVFQFLRERSGRLDLCPPPLRASFIIDDPNLHWPTYGFADYRSIAAHARRENYHVSFATIPLDAWFIHQGSANIFRESGPWLSLLVHGNNHARHELALPYTPESCSAMLQQAISRIESIEARSGLKVSRVMVPPHGACASNVLAELPAHGFESACISAGSLRAHNVGQDWTKSVGLAPIEIVRGCPVLPRWGFGATTESSLLYAAYLGQPLILRGHHQDLRDGLDIFGSFARSINALGDVQWGSLARLSRLNYQCRLDGSTLRVRPLGTTIAISIPGGVHEVIFESGTDTWKDENGNLLDRTGDGTSCAMPVRPGDDVLVVRQRDVVQPRSRSARPARTSARLVLRRILTEARDRMLLT